MIDVVYGKVKSQHNLEASIKGSPINSCKYRAKTSSVPESHHTNAHARPVAHPRH
jgi:hypothetical protein